MFQEKIKPVTRIGRDESGCMYTEYFHLSEQPFSLTPDPRFLFMSERHREGLAHLLYGVQQPGGFVQLTGDIGSGKTTLSRCLVRQLPAETDVALILNPRLTALELLASICDELRIHYPADTDSIKVLIDAINEHLLQSHARHRRTVLIIDEAQNLHSDVLEQIRLLTNLETSQEKLLQIILIGQPELLTLLKQKNLRQLAQRITARYHLLPLSRTETGVYIRHRLFVAGGRDALFTGAAVRSVYRLSRGVPRLINIICDRALLGAYALDRKRVTAAIVRRAARETRGELPWYRSLRPAWILGMTAVAAILLAGMMFLKLAGILSGNTGGQAKSSIQSTSSPEKNKSAPTPVRMDKQIPPAIPAVTGEPFADLLAKSEGSLSSNLSDLYARRHAGASLIPAGLNCSSVQEYGLECLPLVGGWQRLRRYNSPASLDFALPGGTRKRATLVKLDGGKAIFIFGGREYAFPIEEVDRLWQGSFLLLWKPPFPLRELSPGMRGADVAWLRRTLDALDGKPPSAVSDLFDEELRQRIVAFQRRQALVPDGLMGSETLVRLIQASEDASAPSLTGIVY